MRPFTPVSSRHPAHLRSIHAIANFFLSAWRRYRHQRRLQMTMLLLHKLDDRGLKDIGLTRSEIEPAVRNRCLSRGAKTLRPPRARQAHSRRNSIRLVLR